MGHTIADLTKTCVFVYFGGFLQEKNILHFFWIAWHSRLKS